MVRTLWIAALVAGLLAGGVAAQAPKAPVDLNDNAALKYWQAFANLPRLDDKALQKIQADCLTMPLDAQAKRWVEAASLSLREMHYAAGVQPCAWGLTFQEGAFMALHHSQAARTLGNFACLRARLRFEQGKSAEAVDDAVAALTLGRHVSRDATLIGVLIGAAVEHVTIEALAAHLPKLAPAAREKLAARLGALPASGTVADALKLEERGLLDWFIRRVKEARGREDLVRFLEAVYQSKEKAAALLEACGGTARGIVDKAEAMRPIYGTAARLIGLPADRVEKEWQTVQDQHKDNPVFKLLAPALGKLRQAEARLQTRRAMLAAALAVLKDGRDALKTHPDPYDGAAFQYKAVEGGFELRSKLKMKDRPMTLTVGGTRKK